MKTKKWTDLYSKIPAGRREKIAQRLAEASKEMPLHRLREARRFTQKQLAEAMQLDQSRVSKIERRADVYVSTLRNFVEAMGGELELVAKFPDGRVKISSLGGKLDLVATIED